LKRLELDLDACRQSIPKSKFSFKKKALSGTATPTKPSSKTEPPPPSSTSASTSSQGASNLQYSYVNLHSIFAAEAFRETNSDITLSALDTCIVNLLSSTDDEMEFGITALYVRGLRRTVVIAGSINGSVRIEDCEGCIFVLGGRQVCSILS